MSIAKMIPDNPSKNMVTLAFRVLSGSITFTRLSAHLPPPINTTTMEEVDISRWKSLQTWVDWWTREQVPKKLNKAFSDLTGEDLGSIIWHQQPS